MEVPVVTAKANVMLYDGESKSWVASGPENGVSKVQLYRNESTNTYRIVGWRLQDREVVINCALIRGLQYNEARPTFHQWRDSKRQVYGLNFISAEEASAFANAVHTALEYLAIIHQQKLPQQTGRQQQQTAEWMYQPPNAGVMNDTGRSSAALQPYGGGGDVAGSSDRGSIAGEYQFPSTNGSYSGRPGHNNIGSVSEGAYGGSHVSDSRFYSSSDDSVKGLVVGPGVAAANGPASDLATGIAAMKLRPGDPHTSQSVPSSAAPVVPPPPPPPVLKSMLADQTAPHASRSSQRFSVTTAPSGLGSAGCAGASDEDEDATRTEEDGSTAEASSGLAAQLQQAIRQKRLRAASLAPLPTGTNAGVGSGTTTGFATTTNNINNNSGTMGRDNPRGSVDMLSDLRQVLAARRRAQEVTGAAVSNEAANNTSPGLDGGNNRAGGDISGYSRLNTATTTSINQLAADSVSCFATLRKNSNPAFESGIGPPLPPTTVVTSAPSNVQTNNQSSLISRADLEQFKRELLCEFRREVQQLKNDVVEALRTVISQ